MLTATIAVIGVVVGIFVGRELEARRWTYKCELNGTRMFHKGQSYKVIRLPIHPTKADD